MRKILSLVLILCLVLSLAVGVSAADNSREYLFELTVDGSDTQEVQTGDVITVVFHLIRTDAAESYDMYAMQNEIRYDSEFFELVEGSELLSSGITTTDIGLRDTYREFYMNFVSLSGGEQWDTSRLVGSFQLRVIAESGVSKITNQDFLVSTQDGMDHYEAIAQDVTIIVSSECTVKFESNGGTDVPEQTVNYGGTVKRPDDPIRDGYTLAGWYSDIDLQNPWDFDTDTVKGNLTLYAKWEEGIAMVGGTDDNGTICWIVILVLLILLVVLMVLLFTKKRVKFETRSGVKIKAQRVRKGKLILKPVDPQKPGRDFSGWYTDQACTKAWNFQKDKVADNMTLYAKWE